MTGQQLRETLERLTDALARMPDAGLAKGDPRYDWWWNVAAPALAAGRAALAAPVEGCDHEWVNVSNRAVESGKMCLKCRAIRVGPAEESSRIDAPHIDPIEQIDLPDPEAVQIPDGRRWILARAGATPWTVLDSEQDAEGWDEVVAVCPVDERENT